MDINSELILDIQISGKGEHRRTMKNNSNQIAYS